MGFDILTYALLVFVGLPILITLILRPHLIIYLLIVTMVVPWYNISISFGPVNVYVNDLILAFYCCYAGCIVLSRIIKRNKIFDVSDDARALTVFVLLYIMMHVGFMFFALFQGISPDSIIRRFLIYSGCLYFYFPLFFPPNKMQIRNLMIFIVIISVLYLPQQLYSFIVQPEWVLAKSKTSSDTIRLGSAGMPILACGLFTILIWKNKAKYYVLGLFPIISFFLIGHRSAYLALGASLILVLKWTKGVTKSALLVYLGSFLLFFTLLGVGNFLGYSFIDDVLKRGSDTFNLENPTTAGRLYAIGNNFFIFKKKPILGIGYNHESLRKMFPPAPLVGDTGDTILEKNVLHPHNFVIRHLSHTGISGTFLIFTIIFLVLKRCYSSIREGGMLRDPGVFLFGSISFFLILALMNTTFVAEGWFFWVLCGVTVFFSRDVEQNADWLILER